MPELRCTRRQLLSAFADGFAPVCWVRALLHCETGPSCEEQKTMSADILCPHCHSKIGRTSISDDAPVLFECRSSYPFAVMRSMECYERELGQLRKWKAEALAVESQWDLQALADRLGVEKGKSIQKELPKRVDAILLYLRRLEVFGDEMSARLKLHVEGKWNPNRVVATNWDVTRGNRP